MTEEDFPVESSEADLGYKPWAATFGDKKDIVTVVDQPDEWNYVIRTMNGDIRVVLIDQVKPLDEQLPSEQGANDRYKGKIWGYEGEQVCEDDRWPTENGDWVLLTDGRKVPAGGLTVPYLGSGQKQNAEEDASIQPAKAANEEVVPEAVIPESDIIYQAAKHVGPLLIRYLGRRIAKGQGGEKAKDLLPCQKALAFKPGMNGSLERTQSLVSA